MSQANSFLTPNIAINSIRKPRTYSRSQNISRKIVEDVNYK